MFNYIKQFINKKTQETEKKKQLVKAKAYYKLLQEGSLFIKFIHDDIEHMKNKKLNREQRKRFEKDLKEKGEYSKEMVEFYSKRIDEILKQIEENLKPSKKQPKKNV